MHGLSIIIINYNTFEMTSKCIASVYDHLKEDNFEIILVDNASVECNPDLFLEKYPTIHLIKSAENVGFAKGNNLGIEKAKYDTILLLNSDAFLTDNSTWEAVQYLEKHKNVAVVTGQLNYADGRIQHNCQSFPSFLKSTIEKLRLHKFLSKKKRSSLLQGFYFDYTQKGHPDWVWGAYFMFRKEILKHLPAQKLNDDFFMYGEDMLWCFEFRTLGYDIVYFPQIKIIHLLGGSSGKSKEWIHENHQQFLRKNYSFVHRFLLRLF